MELKLRYLHSEEMGTYLLIVPYGIETKGKRCGPDGLNTLLIVPYGIETRNRVLRLHVPELLIVPYGIETSRQAAGRVRLVLLIVPYGIETNLWNHFQIQSRILLIVPYGIETTTDKKNKSQRTIF